MGTKTEWILSDETNFEQGHSSKGKVTPPSSWLWSAGKRKVLRSQPQHELQGWRMSCTNISRSCRPGREKGRLIWSNCCAREPPGVGETMNRDTGGSKTQRKARPEGLEGKRRFPTSVANLEIRTELIAKRTGEGGRPRGRQPLDGAADIAGFNEEGIMKKPSRTGCLIWRRETSPRQQKMHGGGPAEKKPPPQKKKGSGGEKKHTKKRVEGRR